MDVSGLILFRKRQNVSVIFTRVKILLLASGWNNFLGFRRHERENLKTLFEADLTSCQNKQWPASFECRVTRFQMIIEVMRHWVWMGIPCAPGKGLNLNIPMEYKHHDLSHLDSWDFLLSYWPDCPYLSLLSHQAALVRVWILIFLWRAHIKFYFWLFFVLL